MNVGARQDQTSHRPEPAAEQDPAVKAAGGWINQFARTLKTCRLYDANNPTVGKFRQELAIGLKRLIDEHGPMAFKFTADDVLYEGASLYPARSRDDNLALPFYRDGVRTLTFTHGIEPREVDALVDSVIKVTGQNERDDDFVTLLWEAHLPHLEIDYVPAEGDLGTGGPGADSATVPWPTGTSGEQEGPEDTPAKSEASATQEETSRQSSSRSDDWSVKELTAEIEASFVELESMSTTEVERFRREYEAEHSTSLVSSVIGVASAYLAAGSRPEDRVELARFLPRALRRAFAEANWSETHRLLELLEQCGSSEWSTETFSQELMQPISISSITKNLEHQDPSATADFIHLVRALGEPAPDVILLVLAEVENPKIRRQLTESVTEIAREHPEQLAPWLSDPRETVVRNTVQMLGAIGGGGVVGLLQAVLKRPEPSIRQEVVGALRNVEPKLARPLLLQLLTHADTRMFCSVLHQLSEIRDTESSRILLDYLKHADFEKRPIEEKRAIYSALSSVGGDEVIPELEAELHKGNWFTRGQDAHRQAVARCIARIGTPLAMEVLKRGAQSRRGPVRKACEDVLPRLDSHG